MRKHIFLILSAALLLMSHAVFASLSKDDDGDGESKPSVTSTHKRSREEEVDQPSSQIPQKDDTQCYRVPIIGPKIPPFDEVTGEFLDKRINVGDPSVSVVVTPQDSQEKIVCGRKTWFQKLSQPNTVTSLHLEVQLEILQYLDPESQNHLLRTCRYYRAFAQPVGGQDHANVPHNLRIDLLMTSIAKQSGDLDLFMKDQRSTFRAQRSDDREQARRNQIQRIDYLRAAIASRYYNGTLSPNTKHGRTYRDIGPESIDRNGKLCIYCRSLRLVPLNFQGVERASKLYPYGNQLTVTPVLSGLTRLEILDLAVNRLTETPDVTGLTRLEMLDLSNNKLTETPDVTGLTRLAMLYLSNNKLTVTPDVTGLTRLEILYLYGNQLTETPDVTGLTRLERLNLSNNKLTETPDVTGLTRLERLDLSNNKLTETPDVTGLTRLEMLDLSNNKLTETPDVTGLTALRELHLDKGLYEDPTLLNTLRELNEGRQSWNKITLQSVSKDALGKDVFTKVSLD